MAKIRIYELARDLNMTNKMLIEKISDMNISVKSHMSSLDSETVAKLKSEFFGAPAHDIEEVRIKSTVIRRRKKPQLEDLKAQSPKDQAEIQPEESEIQPKIKSDKEIKLAQKEIPDDSVILDSVELKDSEEEINLEPEIEKQAKNKDEKKAETKAKIVKKIERKPEEAKESKEESKEEPKKGILEVVEEPIIEVESETKQVLSQKDSVEGKENQKADITDKTEESKLKAKKKKPKKIKKQKKDIPARIIKLAVITEEPPHKDKFESSIKNKKQVAKDEVKVNKLKKSEENVNLQIDKKVKKKNKKSEDLIESKDENASKDIKGKVAGKWFKKKVSFRRKEVVEGSDLYDKKRFKNKKGGQKKQKSQPVNIEKTQITTPKAIKRRIKIDDSILLADLSKRIGVKANNVIKKLMELGVMATLNQTVDYDTAVLVASEFEYEVEKASFKEDVIIQQDTDQPDELKYKPPVVTIMGHVDHGKTSLLDVIRKSKVTEGEAGGITQHIGAYQVEVKEKLISFLDTPGHEAFTSMRARGAMLTDIVVLIVAADDGVMPQTLEAINHAKASKVPIIVAINKIDKNNAEPERVQRELSEHGLVPEDWGGDTIFVKVSAKENIGIDTLLEMIILQTEMLELKANPDRLAVGYVIESKLDPGRGPVATVLIKNGTLKVGENIICGVHYGKIRAMLNDRGVNISLATPSMPVEIIGLTGVPVAGDEFVAIEGEKDAKQLSSHRIQQMRSKELSKSNKVSLDGLFEKIQQEKLKELNLILKTDVHGSAEALKDALIGLSIDEVKVNIVHSATGTIHESDISLAAVSSAIIIGFNVRANSKVTEMAAEEKVDIRYYNVIYDIIKDIKDSILGLMSAKLVEHTLGKVEVREVFQVPKIGAIAGSYVVEGKIERGKHVRLLRDGVVCYDGKISSLRRFKDDVKEVAFGYECGLGIEKYNDIKIGDIIECYYEEEVKPEM